MEFKEPTIIKLKTGGDIIAVVREVTKTRLVLENPFTIETLMLLDQNGVPRDERILMKKWCNWTRDNVISLPKTQVLDCMAPNDKAVAHYMVVLKNGGIFRLSEAEQEELEEGAAFMQDLIEELRKADAAGDLPSADQMQLPFGEIPEQLPPEETNGGTDKDFGNRPNDWSPDPRDYF